MKNYREYDRATLDRLYSPEIGVANVESLRSQYRADSDKVRSVLKTRLDVAYGPGPAQKLDIYLTDKPRAPILVFIHGGAWRGSNKSERAFPALVFSRAGAIFISIEYPLAPAVSVDEIVRQAYEAIVWIHRNAESFGGDPARIHVSGNSAGAQLAAMILGADWKSNGIPETVCAGGCLISGIFDLEPLRLGGYNEWLKLDPGAAARNSPILHLPARGCPLVVAAGRDETSEFVRQSLEYFNAWVDRGFDGALMIMPRHNHFSIIGELGNPASLLCQAALHQMGLGPGGRR
ncbi:MAG: alpha/beta hydrolase [Candidatus Binataceae bacterium]